MQQEKGRANSLRQARLKVQVLFCVPIVQSNVKQVIQTVTITLFLFGFPSVMNTSDLLEKPKLEIHTLSYGLSFSTQIYGLKISMQVISLGAKTWLICSLQYRFSSEMEVASKILTS